ncbi:MAG: ATP-binding protein [Candidatus Aminicenantes bacterium]|jgi:MinD superfamily P-loop ATPase
MKQLTVISGKGGTGKTVFSASFAALASNTVLVDCDVDAANLFLLLHPQVRETYRFTGGKKAQLVEDRCTGCYECLPVCRFDALSENENSQVNIDPFSCEGCGVCAHVCPVEALEMIPNLSGEWFVSDTRYGPFVHAKLGIGEENSGKLVAEIRKKAKEIAKENGSELILIDGPPGIGCPVIASLSGADMALVVTEPTLAGIHDMERVIQTAQHFRIKTACCINKFDLNLDNSDRIIKWCRDQSVPFIGTIPYDETVTQAVRRGVPVVEYMDCPSADRFKIIWDETEKLLNTSTRNDKEATT